MLAGAQPAHAASFVVCPLILCYYKTITSAVNTAHDGDTITVMGGTYPENDITIESNITINGAGSNLVTVDAQNKNQVFIIGLNTTVSMSV
jgi:hypothetical protein